LIEDLIVELVVDLGFHSKIIVLFCMGFMLYVCLLTTVLSVFLQFTASDYHFGIFKLLVGLESIPKLSVNISWSRITCHSW